MQTSQCLGTLPANTHREILSYQKWTIVFLQKLGIQAGLTWNIEDGVKRYSDSTWERKVVNLLLARHKLLPSY